MCYDSRADKVKGLDLADKELAILIEELAEKGVHVVVILDCCHSGSATRNTDDFMDGCIRATKTRHLSHPSKRAYLDRYYEKMLEAGKEVVVPRSKHILLAGCQRDEYSREIEADNGERRGAFTYCLEKALKTHGTQITYANLFSATRTAILQRRKNKQHPHFEPFGGFDSHSLVLEGANPQNQPIRYEVHYEENRWVTEFGLVAGLQPKAVFGIYDAPKEGRELTTATTEHPELNQSQLKIKKPEKLDEKKRYWAKLTSMPLSQTSVCIEGKTGDVETFRREFKEFNSLYLQESTLSGADITIAIRDNAYHIYHKGAYKYSKNLPNNATNRQKAILKMEQIARWEILLHARNRQTSIDEEAIDFYFQEGYSLSGKVVLPENNHQMYAVKCERGKYSRTGDKKWDVPYTIVAQNNSSQKLYFTLLNFSSDYGILFCETEVAPDKSNKVVLKNSLYPLKEGEEVIYYKLLISTRQIKHYLLTQPGLNDEGARFARKKPCTPDDWTSKTIAVKISKA